MRVTPVIAGEVGYLDTFGRPQVACRLSLSIHSECTDFNPVLLSLRPVFLLVTGRIDQSRSFIHHKIDTTPGRNQIGVGIACILL